MATAYERLARIRDRAVEVRDALPIGSVEGELYTELVDALEAAILEVTTAEPEPEETYEEPKELKMPERFDFDAFLLDMFNPSRHMAVAVWE